MGPRFRKRLDESIAGILSFYDQRDTLALMVGSDTDKIAQAFRARYETPEEYIDSRIMFDCAFTDLDHLMSLPFSEEDLVKKTLIDEPLEVVRDMHLLGAFKLQAREFY